MMIASNNTGLITGDVNYYALNPWKNPFAIVNSTEEDPESAQKEEDPEEPVVNNQCAPLYDGVTDIRVCDDHVVLGGALEILRVPYFDAKLKDLASFWGFVPRWYIPHVQFDFESFDYPVSLTLIVVD